MANRTITVMSLSVRGWALFVLFGLIAASCSGADPVERATQAAQSTSIPSSPSPAPISSQASDADPEIETETVDILTVIEGDSSYVFDQSALRTYELHLTEEALATLDADPAAEEYVEGSMTFEGQTLGRVGIRYKGSIGAFVGCVSGRDFTQPSGEKTCTKLSMKVKINWTDPDAEFFGQRKLQFHSQNLDPSQFHERLGYLLLRDMDVPAPRSVHARLIVNGEFVGLFALTEQVDGRFTRANFDDGTGNLYKEVWPVTEAGEVRSHNQLLEALKTNEDEDASTDIIRALAMNILESNNPADTIAKWMDMDEVLAMAVVDRIIRNDDGVFHWYCDRECGPHNFYWYEEPSTSTVHLIPWDLDNAFQNIVENANPVTPIKDGWGEITDECRAFAYGAFGIRQKSAACDPIIAAWTQFETEYQQMLVRFIEGPFAEERIDEVLTAWEEQIAGATAEAAAVHDDAVTVAAWRLAVSDLRDSLDFARNGALG